MAAAVPPHVSYVSVSEYIEFFIAAQRRFPGAPVSIEAFDDRTNAWQTLDKDGLVRLVANVKSLERASDRERAMMEDVLSAALLDRQGRDARASHVDGEHSDELRSMY